MDDSGQDGIPDDEPCEQCGLCCRIFGPDIAPTPANVYVWIEQGRKDILRWFVAFFGTEGSANCADLSPDDLGDIAFIEMRDPETGAHVPVCPFLRRVSKGRYLCGIHPVKPEMCGNYQPWVWGETYFNRCKALKKTDGRGLWQP